MGSVGRESYLYFIIIMLDYNLIINIINLNTV